MKWIFQLVLIVIAGSYQHLLAQGCSDAGFCTINSFKPNSYDSASVKFSRIKAGISFGRADHSLSAVAAYVEFNQQVSRRIGFDLKLTSLSQSGDNLSVFGLSDIYANVNYKLHIPLSLTVGAKVPLSDANRMKNGISLPMDYQSTLGTLDLIAGVAYRLKRFQIVGALQQPLTQNNNGFIASDLPENMQFSGFQSTKEFERSGDVLLRISYVILPGSRFRITPGILPIYHLSEDRFTDALGRRMKIRGSSGLTLNGNIYFDYDVSNRHSLQLNAGVPFIVRESRPDGLTRSIVIGLEYSFRL